LMSVRNSLAIVGIPQIIHLCKRDQWKPLGRRFLVAGGRRISTLFPVRSRRWLGEKDRVGTAVAPSRHRPTRLPRRTV
jgi:hypothetical protein